MPERLGILGGTFDPVHNAHLAIARVARDAAGLNRVVLIPAGHPPNKAARELTAAAHRLNMARLAVLGMPGFEASDIEIRTPGLDYTVDTLREISAANPGARLFFIAGGDSLMYLDQWRDPGMLLGLASFVAVYRPGFPMEGMKRKREELLERFGGDILLAECEGMDFSSTEIRRRVAAGESISGLVPKNVEAYIRAHGLYGEGI